ncbi:hypothetical protein ACB094_07G032800 [Castanea mollissima]
MTSFLLFLDTFPSVVGVEMPTLMRATFESSCSNVTNLKGRLCISHSPSLKNAASHLQSCKHAALQASWVDEERTEIFLYSHMVLFTASMVYVMLALQLSAVKFLSQPELISLWLISANPGRQLQPKL